MAAADLGMAGDRVVDRSDHRHDHLWVNDTKSKQNIKWQGFTLHWYRNLFAIQDLTTALKNSITISIIVTIIATVLGTLMGVALGKVPIPRIRVDEPADVREHRGA